MKTKIKWKENEVKEKLQQNSAILGFEPSTTAKHSSLLRWKVTKLNNGVRGKHIAPSECSIFWENVSVFSLCVIIIRHFPDVMKQAWFWPFLTSSNGLYFWQLFTNELADWNDLYTEMFVEVGPTDFCKFDLANTPAKPLIAKMRESGHI